MKNLKKMELTELNNSELEETSGGIIGVVLFPIVLIVLYVTIVTIPKYLA
ncbi:hypothetical protein BH09BAC3_BH09BAC3_20330 [soil metagenome]